MPILSWSDILSVGIEEIDEEHKMFIELVNKLYDSLQAGSSPTEQNAILSELITHAHAHFAHEERLLAKTDYPGTEAHKKEHKELMRQVLDAQRRFTDGKTQALSMEIIDFFKKWLINHFQGTDMKYAPHLKSQGIS